MRGEDPQQHLHSLFHPLRSPEPLIHPSTHPSWNWPALFLIPSTLHGDSLDLLLGNPLHSMLQRRKRHARWRGVLRLQRAYDACFHPSEEAHSSSEPRATDTCGFLIVKWRNTRQLSKGITQLLPGKVHWPTGRAGRQSSHLVRPAIGFSPCGVSTGER